MASVKQSWIKKYGEIEGLRLWEERKKLSAITEDNLIKKYGLEECSLRWLSYKNKLKIRGTKKWYVDKFGDKDGTTKWLEKNSKLSVRENTLKNNGFSNDEINVIRTKHRIKSIRSIDNFVNECGNYDKGIERYNVYREKNRLTSSWGLNYWVEKCNGNMEEAKLKLTEHQSRNIEWWKAKYGEVDGVIKYNNWVIQTTKAIMSGDNVSKGQILLENDIKEFYEGTVLGYQEKYGIILTNSEKKEYEIKNSILYPDIILPEIKVIVNYHGDFWHGSENIFNDENLIIPRVNKTVKEVRLIDNEKDKLYTNRGYMVITVWENDYQKNKESIIIELKKKIYENN